MSVVSTRSHFFGHIVNKDVIKPNPENVSKILDWPPPCNVTEIRQILDLASYFRKFVKDLSAIARFSSLKKIFLSTGMKCVISPLLN